MIGGVVDELRKISVMIAANYRPYILICLHID